MGEAEGQGGVERRPLEVRRSGGRRRRWQNWVEGLPQMRVWVWLPDRRGLGHALKRGDRV